MKRSIIYLVAFVAIQLIVSYLVSFLWLLADGCTAAEAWARFAAPYADGINASLFIVQSAAYSLVTMILFILLKWADVSPHYLRQRQWGVFAWAVVASIGTIVPSLALQDLMPPLPDVTREAFRQIIGNDYGYFTICLFAPLVEEIVFRGAVLRALLKSMPHPALAVTVSAVFFAAVHFNPAQMPHAFLVGLLLGWMCWRTGSILPGVAFHWANNTIAFAVCRLMPHWDDMTLLEIFRGSQRSLVMAIAFSMLILLPALYQLHVSMKRV